MTEELEIPAGVYLQGSYTAIVLRVSRGRVRFITLAAMTLEAMELADFLRLYTRWLPTYPVERAAHMYLRSELASRMTEKAREELTRLTGDDLLE